MKAYGTQHLSEDQIIRAVIDETEVPGDTMNHLAQCPVCRGEKLRLERNLAALGDAASRFVPRPKRAITLPDNDKRALGWFAGKHSWVLASTACAALLLFLVGWNFFVRFPQNRLAGVQEEIQKDAQFMAQVDDLVENPLPQVYRAIAGEGYAEGDEDLMNFMFPETGEDSDDASSV
jgi:hypothetical protein